MTIQNTISKLFLTWVIAALCCQVFVGCDGVSDSPVENAVEEVEDSIDDVGDDVEDAVDDISDAADELDEDS